MADRIIGRIPVLECLRARRRAPRRLYVLSGAKGLEEILAAAAHVPVEERPRIQLDQLARGAVHQGVILDADPLPLYRLEDWVRQEFPSEVIVIVLDGVEDPHNFGAIVRSAAACGARAVVFGKDRAAPVSSASMKSATGAMEYVDLVVAANLARALELLKQSGFWVAGLDACGDKRLWDADLKGRVAIVVGSEGRGMRRLVAERCDFTVSIPLTGPITSLNASVSAAVALVECLRQRSR